MQRNQGHPEVRVGELSLKCAEKTGFPSLGFFLQGDNRALQGRKSLPEGKTAARRFK
jgi:hypothetical protein